MTADRLTSDECRHRIEEISEYLDGDLSPARAAALERHLEACLCCAEFATSLRQAVLACRNAGLCQLPEDVRARARQRVTELLAASDHPYHMRTRPD
jgi:anti-sigma factor RsiW